MLIGLNVVNKIVRKRFNGNFRFQDHIYHSGSRMEGKVRAKKLSDSTTFLGYLFRGREKGTHCIKQRS